MIRHPHYLDIPWDIHWEPGGRAHHLRLWWMIGALVFLAIVLTGVAATGGIP